MPKNNEDMRLTVGVLVATVFMMGWMGVLQHSLQQAEAENRDLRQQLGRGGACAPVMVTCSCPEYEEGWDDAKFVEGCVPHELDPEALEVMCDELDSLGYVPRC